MIIADTHIHFYPYYDVEKAFESIISNLAALDSNACKAVFLTERNECCFFSDLKSGRIDVDGRFSVEECAEVNAVRINSEGKFQFYIFAGRQVATAERLEVLSLTSDEIIADGTPARDVIASIEESGGVPVLPWALGKWTFARKARVRALLDEFGSERLLAADSSMRPIGLPESSVMRYARLHGFKVLAGSDPMPGKGEEKYMGRYASLINGDIADSAPVTSIRKILSSTHKIASLGKRNNIIEVASRQVKL